MKIAILGVGEIGRAIQNLLAKKEAILALWDKDQTRSVVPTIDEAVKDASFVFLCVPSFAYPEILISLPNNLSQNAIVVSLAKGMSETGKSMAELLAEGLGGREWGMLAGPMIAEELTAGKPGAAVFASSSAEAGEKIMNLFSETLLTIRPLADYAGASLASVLKNVYAVIFGVGDGLGFGVNFKARLFVSAIEEMKKIIFHLGGNPDTAEGLAGSGDLFATAVSADSRNHAFGVEIGRGKKPEFFGEGAISYTGLKVRLGNDLEKYPLISAFEKLLKEPENAAFIMEKLNKIL